MILEPFDFLRSVEVFTPRDDRTVQLATVYTMHADGVRVTFDGESSPTLKRYLLSSPGNVVAGDRVVMLRAGSSWVVVGALEATPAEDYAPLADGCGATFTHGAQSVASGTVVTLDQWAVGTSYGDGTRPSVALGKVQIPAGIWAMTWRARVTGTGFSGRYNVQMHGGDASVGSEYPVNSGTHLATLPLVARYTATTELTHDIYQDSGYVKDAATCTMQVHRIARG